MFDKEPEDIFSDVLPAKTETLRPHGSVSPTVPGRPGEVASVGAKPEVMPEEIGEAGGGGKKKIFLALTAVVLILVLGGGGYLAWKQFGKGRGAAMVNEVNAPQVSNNVNEEPTVPEVIPTPEVAVPPVTSPALDSDSDGLTDDEETILGTSITKSDTDEDGLNDKDEVQIYRTNPLNPDTDGDTYSDGSEVQNGYNPNGPGKLFELPQ